MVTSCCVPRCKSRAGKQSVSFFRIPRSDIAQKWTKLLKISRKVTPSMKVCSLHFTAENFFPGIVYSKPRLLPNALPSQNLPTLSLNVSTKTWSAVDTVAVCKRDLPTIAIHFEKLANVCGNVNAKESSAVERNSSEKQATNVCETVNVDAVEESSTDSCKERRVEEGEKEENFKPSQNNIYEDHLYHKVSKGIQLYEQRENVLQKLYSEEVKKVEKLTRRQNDLQQLYHEEIRKVKELKKGQSEMQELHNQEIKKNKELTKLLEMAQLLYEREVKNCEKDKVRQQELQQLYHNEVETVRNFEDSKKNLQQLLNAEVEKVQKLIKQQTDLQQLHDKEVEKSGKYLRRQNELQQLYLREVQMVKDCRERGSQLHELYKNEVEKVKELKRQQNELQQFIRGEITNVPIHNQSKLRRLLPACNDQVGKANDHAVEKINDQVTKTNNQARKVSNEVGKSNDQVEKANDQVRKVSDDVGKSNDQVGKTNELQQFIRSEIENVQNQNRSMLRRLLPACHNQVGKTNDQEKGNTENNALFDDIKKLKLLYQKQKTMLIDLKKRMFSIEALKVRDNEEYLTYFTGLKNYKAFEELLIFLVPTLNVKDCINFIDVSHEYLPLGDQLLMVLTKLRRNIEFNHFSFAYGKSLSGMSKLYKVWLNYLHSKLDYVPEPHKNYLNKLAPAINKYVQSHQEEDKQFKCSLCHYSVRKKRSLKSHLEKKHKMDGEKIYSMIDMVEAVLSNELDDNSKESNVKELN